ncbi:class I SAM-dependent RNA methyltransferase [Nostocoides australiense]
MIGGLAVGDRVEVEVGPVAHGGHCVARYEGQVLFVRHTLPGERVVAEVTGIGSGNRFVYADARAVLTASPDRVVPPCPYAGRCGGCDFQHVALPAQRELKAAVVREQLQRLARLDLPVEVEPVPGDRGGLRWRTRAEFAVSDDRRVGMRPHRSHEVLSIDDCLIATDAVVGTGVLHRDPSTIAEDVGAFDVVAPSVGEPVVVPVPQDEAPDPVPDVAEHVAARMLHRQFAVSARGFWQVHPGAPATFVDAVLEMLAPRPGERALDLYSGVGVFAAALAEAVGPVGQVIAIESDATATRHAEANLAAYRHVVAVRARVDDAFGLPRQVRGPRRGRTRAGSRHPLLPHTADVVVLDPPRTGAGKDVCCAVAALSPRAIAYVACDPAALARDLATLTGQGYAVTRLRSFDAFPMTHHVECLALLEPAGGRIDRTGPTKIS